MVELVKTAGWQKADFKLLPASAIEKAEQLAFNLNAVIIGALEYPINSNRSNYALLLHVMRDKYQAYIWQHNARGELKWDLVGTMPPWALSWLYTLLHKGE